jgi:two-component system, chemotaxis family, protein-glutamate methylesterase/glutaminase
LTKAMGEAACSSAAPRKIRVLVVDDSAVVRRLITEALRGDAGIEVIGTAPDPYVARDRILEMRPDVLTLDIEMPRMDGLSFLRRLMHYRPMPVLIVSSLGQAGCEASLEALRLGAVDVLAKPAGAYSVGDLALQLPGAVRAAYGARRNLETAPQKQSSHPGATAAPVRRHLVAIGSSTGGTQAVEQVLAGLAGECPPIVVAQHIPAGFSAAFARRLNHLFPMEVKEAETGDLVSAGRVLIAPGNRHMVLEAAGGREREDSGARYRVAVKDGPLVCYQRPSVDVLFRSVSRVAGSDAVGVILTGMGNDGAAGMKQLREARGWTLAQSEATCVVYGMPREAVEAGAVDEIVDLDRMAAAIQQGLRRAIPARVSATVEPLAPQRASHRDITKSSQESPCLPDMS